VLFLGLNLRPNTINTSKGLSIVSIKKPAAVESPYVTTDTTPTRLASGPVAGGGVTTVAATVSETVGATADANANTTTSSSTGSNVSYYTSGIEGIAGLASSGRVFDGANVYVTLEQPQYVTYNQTFTIGDSISVTGNITSGEYFIGDGSQLTGISSSGNLIVNGNSKVDVVSPNGNVVVDINGNYWLFNSNSGLIAPGGSQWQNQANSDAYFTSSLDGYVHLQSLFADGNIGSEVFLEHGLLTLIAHSVGANADYVWTFDNGGNLTLPGNTFQINYANGDQVTLGSGASNYIVNGNSYANIASANGPVIVSANGNSWTFSTNSTLTAPGGSRWTNQANADAYFTSSIDGYVHLQSLFADGNIGSEMFLQHGLATITAHSLGANADYVWTFDNGGNLTLPGNTFQINYANGTPASLGSTYGNANVVANLAALGSNPISTTGTVTAGNITGGNVLTGGLISATSTITSAANITGGNVLTGGVISATANINGGNVLTGGLISATSTITSAANITGGNLLTGGLISATGNITGNYILGNGSQLTSINAVTVDITDTNGLTTVYYPTFVENRTTAQIARADVDLTYRTDDNLLTVGNVSVTGNVSGGNLNVTGNIVDTGALSIITGSNGNIALVPNGTGIVTVSSNLSVTGNISANNLALAGNITSSIGFTGATITINNSPGGVEGAEIQWALPAVANTSLSGTFIQDVYANGMRFFESSGNTRGLYMDLGNAPNGSTTAVGYRDIPQVAFTANTTIATTDAGRHYYSTLSTGNVLTIANNASQGFQVGAAISIVNQGSGNITVAQGSGVTLYLAGNATSGNRTVATFGMATLIKVATDTWFINGTGVT
jgi:hypothetical protein